MLCGGGPGGSGGGHTRCCEVVGGDGDKRWRDYCFEFEMSAGVQCDDARLGGRVGVKVITVSSCDMRHMNCL